MNRIALKGGLLIDGTGAPPVKDSLILIEGRTWHTREVLWRSRADTR